MKITKILSFTALSLLGGALQAQEKSLATLVNEKDVFLVDVRSEKEFDQGSALNAVNIPVDKIEKELDQFKGKSNIIVFCRAGRRAEAARKLLEKHHIKAINGGTYQQVKILQKENLMDRLSYRTDKQTVSVIKNGEGVKQVAVALGKELSLRNTLPMYLLS